MRRSQLLRRRCDQLISFTSASQQYDPDDHFVTCSAGFFAAHGRACSSCDAIRIKLASSPKRGANCTGTGSPAALQWSGSEIAGCPVGLESGVNGQYADTWRVQSIALI